MDVDGLHDILDIQKTSVTDSLGTYQYVTDLEKKHVPSISTLKVAAARKLL